MKSKLHVILISTFFLLSFVVYSQENNWKRKVGNNNLEGTSKFHLENDKVHHFELNFDSFKQNLINAPLRGTTNNPNVSIIVPGAGGLLESFIIYEAPVFSQSLSERYPDIKSYVGFSMDNSGSQLRMSVSPEGVQTMITYLDKESVFIMPTSHGSIHYMVYNKSSRGNYIDAFECSTIDDLTNEYSAESSFRDANDQFLRTYRLAVSVNGEYTIYHGGTVAGALAAINATMTRVNAVFETDMAINFELVDADQLIFTDPSSDPYSGNLGNWNVELQNTLTNTIGNAAYDIGHMFGASGGGGNAGCIGCVCEDDTASTTDENKGAGITSPADGIPEGDTFDIDYVAHEIGHQMGANHTWAFNTEGTGVNAEPGSGSTIMAYAGITGANNVQQNSDDYFHYHSINQILNNVDNAPNNCAVLTNITNNPPNADAGPNYSIPQGTAYVLEGGATDPDSGDNLTYCWEQTDSGRVTNTTFGPTLTSGSMNRSLPPTASPDRYIPNLNRVVSNQLTQTNPTINSAWETVSTVTRSLNWALTVRDRQPTATGLGGQSSFDLMTINTVGSAGPFVVNTPNTNVTWDTGATETVTWDVAGTTGNGINAANVDIFLSTDGGFTYPITLALDTPNDGSHDITVPNNPGTQNRIMVKAANNIFFDISNTNFTIQLTSPTFVMSVTPDNNESCEPTSVDYTIELTSLLGFNSPVTLSTSGIPTGASESFSINPVIPTNNTVLTIDPGTANFGTYTVTINAVGGGVNRTFDVSYTITAGTLGGVTLVTPIDNEISVVTSPNLSWNLVSNAESYDVDVATDMAFTNIIFSQSGVTSNSIVASGLSYSTNYFWRVRAANNCVTDSWSEVRQFTTQDIPECEGAVINIFPDLETFDSGIGDWEQGTGDDGDWTLDANGTQSNNTGPSDDITGGGNYFYTEASSNGLGGNATVILNSPCYDLSGLTEAGFSFYYHMFGTNVGSLDLEISSDNGDNWINIFSASGNIGDFWNAVSIDLSPYLGQSVKFRFIGLTGNGWSSDIAIDHIELTDFYTPTYCLSNGNNTNDEYISRVQLETIDNVSGIGFTSIGYSDFTNINTDLYSGMEYSITITPTWTSQVYSEGYAVWIDYNYDGDFDDSGELVWTQTITQNSPVTGSFTVPDDIAFEESTRMRVSMKYNGIPTACESFDYGEVEDYMINLKYDGLLFIDNAWIPNGPSNLTTTDNALIFNGIYNSSANVELNDLIINSGATLEIQENASMVLMGDLNNSGNLTLNSVSNQYASLIVSGVVNGDVAYRRHVNINASSGGNDLISAPVTGQTFGDFAALNANIFSNPSNLSEKLFGPFDKVTESYLTYDTDIPAEAAIILEPGTGYRAASDNNSTFVFNGTVNTSQIDVDILNSGTVYPEWNLIGNPYPSYIRLSDFLSQNIPELLSTSAAIYGYDGDASDGWIIWNQAYSIANPGALIAPGQGFLVSSKIGGGTISFTPNSRTVGSSDDFVPGRIAQNNAIAQLRLQLSNSADNFNTDIYFTDFASRGMDAGFDATVFNGTAPNFAIYSALVEDNQGNDIAIQSVGFDEYNQDIIIPIGINAAQGQQLSISIIDSSIPENIEVYLEDNLNNTFTLLNDSDYVFTAQSNLSGIGRFYLRFESQTLSDTQNNFNNLTIFTINSPKSIVINGLINENTEARIYDMQGRMVLQSNLKKTSNNNIIDVNSFSSGVYLIKLESNTQGKTQKIIIR